MIYKYIGGSCCRGTDVSKDCRGVDVACVGGEDNAFAARGLLYNAGGQDLIEG